MNTLAMAEAKLIADQIRVFQEEIERLETAGVLALSTEQRAAVAGP